MLVQTLIIILEKQCNSTDLGAGTVGELILSAVRYKPAVFFLLLLHQQKAAITLTDMIRISTPPPAADATMISVGESDPSVAVGRRGRGKGEGGREEGGRNSADV